MPQGPRLIAAISIQAKRATAGIPRATDVTVISTGSFTGFNDEVAKALALPSVRERLAKIGVEQLPMTVAEFEQFFKDDVAANLELVKAANIPRQ